MNRGISRSLRRVLFGGVAVALLTSVFAPGVEAASVGVVLGQKALSDAWRPVNRQDEVGFMTSLGRSRWPVHVALDVLVSRGSGHFFSYDVDAYGTQSVKARTAEIAIGLRKSWTVGRMRPSIGAGVAGVGGSVQVGHIEKSTVGAGVWGEAGLSWRFPFGLEIGGFVRRSAAGLSDKRGLVRGAPFNGHHIAGGGQHIALRLGYTWPAGR